MNLIQRLFESRNQRERKLEEQMNIIALRLIKEYNKAKQKRGLKIAYEKAKFGISSTYLNLSESFLGYSPNVTQIQEGHPLPVKNESYWRSFRDHNSIRKLAKIEIYQNK
ncbi:MAG TPA: hypothetical protein PLK34_00525 [Candidatus Pacearchaeota archaeon]|nr:hypothetical protein [Candidatus Pacearchaeota archaeon]